MLLDLSLLCELLAFIMNEMWGYFNFVRLHGDSVDL